MSQSYYTVPTVSIPAIEELKIITSPRDLQHNEKMSLLSGLVSSFGTNPVSHLMAVEMVYNIVHIAVPEFSQMTASITSLRTRSLNPGRIELLQWGHLEELGEGQERPALVSLPGDPRPAAFAVTNTASVFTGIASLLFATSRQASEAASVAALDKRPDALVRRFGIPETDQVILPGKAAGPSRESLETIYNAFSNYPEARATIVRFFLGVQRDMSHYPIHLEVLMTNFHLMRGSGMTHVEAVIKLIKMHPWTLKVPELEPYFSKFAADLAEFNTIDVLSRPYHRLLVPQAKYLFLSSELRPLIAVAGAFIEEVEKTFSGYVYNKDQYTDLIASVKSRAPGYTPTRQLTVLAQLLGIEDAPLPALPAAAPADAAPIV